MPHFYDILTASHRKSGVSKKLEVRKFEIFQFVMQMACHGFVRRDFEDVRCKFKFEEMKAFTKIKFKIQLTVKFNSCNLDF